jgi:hypothetical protein
MKTDFKTSKQDAWGNKYDSLDVIGELFGQWKILQNDNFFCLLNDKLQKWGY